MNRTLAAPKHKKSSLKRWIDRRGDDLFFLAGCGLILYGTWHTWPGAIWFVAGAMCLIWGVLLAIGGRR